jgi:hypothetical protein
MPPPHPYKFLKDYELTEEQEAKLKAKLAKRKGDLDAALKQVVASIEKLVVALDQDADKAKKGRRRLRRRLGIKRKGKA